LIFSVTPTQKDSIASLSNFGLGRVQIARPLDPKGLAAFVNLPGEGLGIGATNFDFEPVFHPANMVLNRADS
jgi:hypothetical protein